MNKVPTLKKLLLAAREAINSHGWTDERKFIKMDSFKKSKKSGFIMMEQDNVIAWWASHLTIFIKCCHMIESYYRWDLDL
jgi:hypothetical protein